MLEWLNRVPVKFFDDTKLVKKIFWVLDQGLSVAKSAERGLGDVTYTSAAGGVRGSLTVSAEPQQTQQQQQQPQNDPRLKIRRTAEQMMIYLGNLLHNFPPDIHYDILQSQVIDVDLDDSSSNPAKAIAQSATPPPATPDAAAPGAEMESAPQVEGAPTPSPTPPSTMTTPITPEKPSPKLPTIFFTNNYVNVYSFQDVSMHDRSSLFLHLIFGKIKLLLNVFVAFVLTASVLSEDAAQGLQWTLANPHYLHFFTAYLGLAELESATSIWYEYQQAEAGSDLTAIKEKARQLVANFLQSPASSTLPPEYPPILQNKLNEKPESALFDLLLIQFVQFKHTDMFNNAQGSLPRFLQMT